MHVPAYSNGKSTYAVNVRTYYVRTHISQLAFSALDELTHVRMNIQVYTDIIKHGNSLGVYN